MNLGIANPGPRAMHKALHRHSFDDSTRGLVSSVAFDCGWRGKWQPCGQSTKEQPLTLWGNLPHPSPSPVLVVHTRCWFLGVSVLCILCPVSCPLSKTRSIKSCFYSLVRETLSPNTIARYMPWFAETSPSLARKI